jgi:alpha-N-acetylglucosamine transferase
MRENESINDTEISRFMKPFDRAIHQTTEVSPSQIQYNKDLKVQYIIDSINKQNIIESTAPDCKLNFNDKVRLIEPNKTMKKAR